MQREGLIDVSLIHETSLSWGGCIDVLCEHAVSVPPLSDGDSELCREAGRFLESRHFMAYFENQGGTIARNIFLEIEARTPIE